MNPSSPSLFSIILFFVLAGSTNSRGDDDPYKVCAAYPFRCGNLSTQVTYPFLAGDRPPICGFQKMNLTCENDSPMIKIGSEEYIVRNISYPERLLTIVDREMWSKDCPLPSRNTTVSHSYVLPASDEVLTIYYGCSYHPSAPEDLSEIPCLGREMSGNYQYSYLSTNPKNEGIGTDCRGVVGVHVMEGAGDRLRRNQSSYVEVMKGGFEVKWLMGAGWCTECVQSGGLCGSNTNVLEQSVCFCPEGTRYASCSQGRLSVFYSSS